MRPIRTIVVPFDFSKHSQAALEMASGLAEQLGAKLHLLHVLKPMPYGYGGEVDMGLATGELPGQSREACLHALERTAAGCGRPADRVEVHVVESPNVPHAIDSEAERLAADLIVMGTHGRTGLAHVLMGSIAEATTRRAPCPVMTVPGEARVRQDEVRRQASRNPVSGAF